MAAGIPADPLLLLHAARDNDVGGIEAAVALGVPVAFANRIGQTALHIASIHGNVEAIEKLVALGCDINVENMMEQTPLHFAAGAHKNAAHACAVLLDLGADADAIDGHGRLPYELSKDDAVRVLLGGPDPRLFDAAAEGNVEALKSIFEEDPEANPAPLNGEGMSPILLAAKGGHIAALEFLLEKGAPTDQHDLEGGNTPLHLAAINGRAEAVKLLIARGADVNDRTFHASTYAKGGWTRAGEELGPLHQTALHQAFESGDSAMAELLLQNGGDPDALDFDGRTVLHYALELQDVDMVELALKYGADPSLGCSDFATPLFLAATQGTADMLAVLLAHGAQAEVSNEDSWTPLMLATRNGKTVAVKALLAAGAIAETANSAGNNSLHLAAANGRVDVCRALLEGGGEGVKAALVAQNKAGKTPAELALKEEVKALLAHD